MPRGFPGSSGLLAFGEVFFSGNWPICFSRDGANRKGCDANVSAVRAFEIGIEVWSHYWSAGEYVL
jgi:hypothetical protein